MDNEITTTYSESISTNLTVTNTDDDTVGITINASNPIAAEGLGHNTFSVELDSEPIGEVEVTFSPSNDDIQLDDEFDGEATTLIFDAENWDDAQEVTVTAVDDYYVEYDHSSTISTTIASDKDDLYNQLTPPNDIVIKITDNDLPIASIEAIAGASEAGAPGYFIIELDNPAPDGVDGTGIEVNYSVTGGTADADGDETNETDDLQPLSGSVRIAPGATRSPIIAFPTDDFKVEAVPLITTGYSNNNVTLAINTEDLTDSLLATLQAEGLTLAADTELTFSDGAIVTVDSDTNLTIDNSGVSSSASVGIVFSDDSPAISISTDETTSVPEETIIISLNSGDDYYIDSTKPPAATLSIQDNDKPGVRIVEAGDSTIVNENGTAEYYVSLLSQPEEEVTIDMVGDITTKTIQVASINSETNEIELVTNDSDISSLLLPAGNYSIGNGSITITEDLTITETGTLIAVDSLTGISASDTFSYSYSELGFANGSETLTFNSDNWYELQTVTVTGIDDSVVETGDSHTSRVLYTVSSADANYDGFEVSPQSIEIIDRIFDRENTTESLTEGFMGLQDAIDNVSLPIIGNLSSVSPSFLEDFLDNLIDEVKNTEDITADSLSEAFNAAFDDTISESGFNSDLFNLGVEITDLSTENIEFLLNIDGEVGESFPLESDLGLSALGISLETSGNLNADFEYGIGLAFGINKEDGFYINTEDTSLGLGAGLSLSDVDAEDGEDFGITGKLGFLQLDIEDGIGDYDANGNESENGGYDADGNEDADGTNISAEFVATLQDSDDTNGDTTQLTLSELNTARQGDAGDWIQYGFSGDATVDLDVTTSFEGDTSFPSLGFNLYSEMPIFNYDNAEDEEELSNAELTVDTGFSNKNENTTTSLYVTASDPDGDTSVIQLNKGTELNFEGNKVVLDSKTFLTPGNSTPISVIVADDGDATVDSVTIDAGDTAELVSGDFNIAFNDITLDLGEFVSDTVSPVIDFIDELIEPFEPIIEVLQTKIGLLKSLGLVDTFDENGDGDATLIEVASTLATLYSGGKNTLKYQQFFDAVTGILELVETIEVQFGDYVLENFSGASDEEDAATIDTEDTSGSNTNLNSNASNDAKSNNKVGNLFSKLEDLGIGIPLLEDPFTAVNLLLGQDIDLITYDIPELDIGFGIEQEFPIFGSIKGILEGDFSLYSDLVVGYDTYGISQWEEADFDLDESYKILDGFYISDLDPDTGEDVDELTMDATIAAGVSASAGVAKVEVTGGVTGTAALDITDGGELTGTSDGKLRGSEVLDADSLLDLFTLSGSLEAFLKAKVKVGIDLGFKEIMKTVWKEKFSVTLFEFELGSSGGSASQYYIEGATVFFDANLDGEQQESEPYAITDSYGNYNLDVPLLYFDTNDNGEIDPEEGQIISQGGIDTSTGLEVETPLIAPYNSKMVTPLTTIKQGLIEDGATPEEAEEQIKTALDLPDVDLDTFDPIVAIARGDKRGATIYQAHNQVQNLFIQGTEFVGELESDFDSNKPLKHQVIKEIGKGIVESGTAVDLSNQSDLNRIFTPLGKKIRLPGDLPRPNNPNQNETFSAFTKTVAWGNQAINLAFTDVPLESVVGDTAEVKQLVQGHLGQVQDKLGRGELSPEELTTKLSTANLDKTLTGLGLPPLPPLPTIPQPDSNLLQASTIIGTIGNDTLIGETGDDSIFGGQGNDFIFGAEGNDFLVGLKDNDSIAGGTGDDLLVGYHGNDFLSGGKGNDSLLGNQGNDILKGDENKDLLFGSLGNDILSGGEDRDTLYGGQGSDIFVLEQNSGQDLVGDFTDGIDRIALDGDLVFADLTITGSNNVRIIDSNDSVLMELSGIDLDQITAEDFISNLSI